MKIFILSFTVVLVVLTTKVVALHYNKTGPSIHKCQALLEQGATLPNYKGQEFCAIG